MDAIREKIALFLITALTLAALLAVRLLLPFDTFGTVTVIDSNAHRRSADPTALALPARFDLNEATGEQLESVPGIGPALAEAILAHRRTHGAFDHLDRLLDIKGIGPALLDTLYQYCTID